MRRARSTIFAAAALTLAASLVAAAPLPPEDSWKRGLAEWKKDRDTKLRRPDGWLTLVGLSWLKPGENRVGSDPAAGVVLPDSVPARLGTIRVAGAEAVFTAAPDAVVVSNGVPVSTLTLRSDLEGDPTVLTHGSVSFYLIERAEKMAIRVKDSRAAALAKFQGLEYYPEDRRWLVEARFEPADVVREVEVPNVFGFAEKILSPGHVTFELGGRTHRLLALDDTGDGRLFLVFGDKTNGRETYGGGRFLYTEPPVAGRVAIDFNRAYNPPCVFSPYATCPLPPPGNKLPLAIAAGEKKYALAVH